VPTFDGVKWRMHRLVVKQRRRMEALVTVYNLAATIQYDIHDDQISVLMQISDGSQGWQEVRRSPPE
jgi:hypothetical protein